MKLKLNQEIAVTKNQYDDCIRLYSGYIAYRRDVFCFIKIMAPGKTGYINKTLNLTE